jgi:hypothetical protein
VHQHLTGCQLVVDHAPDREAESDDPERACRNRSGKRNQITAETERGFRDTDFVDGKAYLYLAPEILRKA